MRPNDRLDDDTEAASADADASAEPMAVALESARCKTSATLKADDRMEDANANSAYWANRVRPAWAALAALTDLAGTMAVLVLGCRMLAFGSAGFSAIEPDPEEAGADTAALVFTFA